MSEVVLTGYASFEVKTPYELVETGKEGEKPLIIYLHGFKQNISRFRRYVNRMTAVEAYHLFIQGPYPLYDREHSRKVEDWGRAWYLYDGDQQQFIASLEQTSSFLEEVLKEVGSRIETSRKALFGYSMGAYLAGYFALSRPRQVDDLVMVGGRLKTEVFEGKENDYDHMNVLALHGSKDESVKSLPQKESVKDFEEWGASVTFQEINEGHRLTQQYLSETIQWLETLNYRISENKT